MKKFFRLRKTAPKSKCFNMQIYEILCIDFAWKRNLGKERSWFSCRSFPFGASRTRAQSASVMRAMVRGDFFISLDNRVYRKLAGSPSGQQVSDRRKAIIGTNVLCVNLRRDNAAWWGCRRWKLLCEPLSREKQERMSGCFYNLWWEDFSARVCDVDAKSRKAASTKASAAENT